MTPLDRAHAAMESGGDGARLRFYERLADAELFLLLEREAEAERIAPRVFPLEDGPVVLAFDTEERLTEFAGPAAYAALSGRALAAHLAGRGLGLGLNLGVAPSSFLVGAEAVDWLARMLAGTPDEAEARPSRFAPPRTPETLVAALDAKFAGLAGRARSACLAAVTYEDGREAHLVAFIGALPGAERALAAAVREAVVFSNLPAADLDVAFLAENDPVTARLVGIALRFDLPKPTAQAPRSPPGSDPDRPPRLR